MKRNGRRAALAAVLITLLPSLLVPATTAAPSPRTRGIVIEAPAAGDVGALFALTLVLPSDVAAFDGRVLVAPGAAEVIGVAPAGSGTAFRPEAVAGGYAIGVFGLVPDGDTSTVSVVVEPLRRGRLQLRLIVDSAVDADGRAVDLRTDGLVTVKISGGDDWLPPSTANVGPVRVRAPSKLKELVPDSRFDRRDLDDARGAWAAARATGTTCTSRRPGRRQRGWLRRHRGRSSTECCR